MPEARVSGLVSTLGGEITGLSDALLVAVKQCDALLVGPAWRLPQQRSASRRHARCKRKPSSSMRARSQPQRQARASSRLTMARWRSCAVATSERSSEDPAGVALRVARELDVVVALKGAITHIANPAGDLWIYRGGSIGLGTSGSGDVLAGVITGLVAQGAAADQAAVWGVGAARRSGCSIGRESRQDRFSGTRNRLTRFRR